MNEFNSKLLPRSQRSSPCQYYSDEDFDLYPPSGKRLAPVGAASNDDEDMASCQETGMRFSVTYCQNKLLHTFDLAKPISTYIQLWPVESGSSL